MDYALDESLGVSLFGVLPSFFPLPTPTVLGARFVFSTPFPTPPRHLNFVFKAQPWLGGGWSILGCKE